MARQKLTERNATTVTTSNDYIHVVKGGISYKIKKSDFQKNITSGFIGSVVSTDLAPTADGIYICEDSGTYTNYGSLVVNLTNTLSFISVEDTQTTFNLIEIPITQREVYVEDYGAVGDGVTDDATSINSAINAIYLDGGGLVRFLSKEYLINSSIILKNGVSLKGINPKLNFGANCPDLSFTLSGGTRIVAGTSGLIGLTANNVDSDGVDSGIDALSNVLIEQIGLKGFKKGIKVGAINQLGMGMGGFRSIYIDGTSSDDTTVVTETAIELWNSQQMYNNEVMLYNVRNGLKIYNDKDITNCSSGNSLWDKFYCYLDPSATSENLSNISTITTGATTTITTSTAHDLIEGDVCQLSGVTGSDEYILNRVHKVESIISTTVFVIGTNTSGKTITSTGTVEKGRVGLHLIAKGNEPLNHISFYSPHVNCFLNTEQSKAICNIALCGVGVSSIGGINLNHTDTEGKTDHHIYIDGSSNTSINIGTVNESPTLGHISVYNSSNTNITSNSQDVYIKIGDTRYTGGNTFVQYNGAVKGFIANSNFPKGGFFYDIANSLSYLAGDTFYPALEINKLNPSIGGSVNSSNNWIPLRLMEKSGTNKITGDRNISVNRCGYWEASNSFDCVVNLPTIGEGFLEAPTGIPLVVSKSNFGGKVVITPASGQTIDRQSTYTVQNYEGASVFLMSDGTDNWVVSAKNETGNALKQGTFANRPTIGVIGFEYFATDKGYPCWWDGTNWVDSTGTTVIP